MSEAQQLTSTLTTEISLPRIQTASLSRAAYSILRKRIISKEMSPGQRLDLDQIKKQLGISKTPLKEALKYLEMEGLITIRPRSGTFVTDPTPEEIADSFDLRRVLEIYAVEILVERAGDEAIQALRAVVDELRTLVDTPDSAAIYPEYLNLDHKFHQKLVSLAGSPRLSQAHDRENMHAQMARIRYRYAARDLTTAQAEHEQLLAALEKKDAARARQVIDAHLKRAKCSLLADMGVTIEDHTAN